MSNMKINTEVLSQEKEKLEKAREKMNTILTDLKKETNELKNHWETNTSESVFNNFEEFCEYYQTNLDNLQNDINFIQTTIDNYTNYEEKTNKEIDEKIAI